ncbi:hypothetical protein GCM10022251_14660 [Phytohabitans flavus]|uniref:Uncharacterized protein n=1 Tax=Phytohabitans flavus TaxID=1076124 RepID=A0A6F8Y706_9ACTN|nr:hypothetical protein Pflav_082130 [Phytohabitans flavus]
MGEREVDRLPAVTGFGHHVDFGVGGEDRLHPGADHGFVVGEKYPDHQADATPTFALGTCAAVRGS